jgi:hypothetical protein
MRVCTRQWIYRIWRKWGHCKFVLLIFFFRPCAEAWGFCFLLIENCKMQIDFLPRMHEWFICFFGLVRRRRSMSHRSFDEHLARAIRYNIFCSYLTKNIFASIPAVRSLDNIIELLAPVGVAFAVVWYRRQAKCGRHTNDM